MAINLGALFGEDSAFRQLLIWQVGAQVVGAILAPALDELQQEVYSVAQTVPLSAPDLADLVVRSFLTEAAGAEAAKRTGISPSDFSLLVKNAAQAPDTTQLVEALRRKIIPADAGSPDGVGFVQGVAQGHLDPKWTDMLLALGEVPIGIADAVDGVVESQLTQAEGEAIAYQNGISAQSFQTLVSIRGNPPSPTQLTEMVHRGIIPIDGTGPDKTSFRQGIAESAWKTKWTDAFIDLMEVLPPARTVTAMVRDGSLTHAQALTIWKQQGYSQEIAAAFLTEASRGKLTTARTLAKSDIIRLYVDRITDRPTALAMLEAYGYEAHEADEELTIQDLHAAIAAQTSAVGKVKSLYLARKISGATASAALDALQVPHAQRDQLLQTWTIERGLVLKTLSEAQIVDAWSYQVLTQAEAESELMALGYTQFDAWVLLSVKNKAPLPGKPSGQPSPEDRYP